VQEGGFAKVQLETLNYKISQLIDTIIKVIETENPDIHQAFSKKVVCSVVNSIGRRQKFKFSNISANQLPLPAVRNQHKGIRLASIIPIGEKTGNSNPH
jgi:hypothetical protein